MLVSLKQHPLNAPMLGDEPGYYAELNYLFHYGFYMSLSQGTSFGYSGLLYILAHIIPIDAFLVMKFFSAISFIACCFIILKIFDRLNNVSYETKYLAMVFFAYYSIAHIWRALPDIPCTLSLFTGVLILLKNRSYRSVVITSLFVFLAFIIKPNILFYIPGILLFIVASKNIQLKQKVAEVILFVGVFFSCFIVYHIPGYQAYGKLMLESKNHMYVGSQRIESTLTWPEINIYYEVYNPNKRINKWAVNPDEVNEFKKNNPGKLDLSYTQFLRQHFNIWAKNEVTKIFLDVPYLVDCGMFYHKWTTVNKWIKNTYIIEFVSLVFLIFCCYKERRMITGNPFLLVPFTYALLLCLIAIPQLEYNWMIGCTPFFALPILEYLQKRISPYIILAAQLLVVLF